MLNMLPLELVKKICMMERKLMMEDECVHPSRCVLVLDSSQDSDDELEIEKDMEFSISVSTSKIHYSHTSPSYSPIDPWFY